MPAPTPRARASNRTSRLKPFRLLGVHGGAPAIVGAVPPCLPPGTAGEGLQQDRSIERFKPPLPQRPKDLIHGRRNSYLTAGSPPCK